MFVIDASVLIADLSPAEAHHQASRNLLDLIENSRNPIIAPEIAVVELASGLARGTGNAAVALQASRLLHRREGLRFVVVDGDLANLAAEIASEGQIRGCDAVYLAVADRFRLPLVSLDRRQTERAPKRIETLSPRAMLDRIKLR
jgi:predicted nucleic acid-binding protein